MKSPEKAWVRNSRKKDVLEMVSILFSMFGFSFLLNFLWEAFHAVYLYQGHDLAASSYVPIVMYVSSMDSLIVLGLYLGVGILWLNLFWIKLFAKRQIVAFAAIGITAAAIIERFYYQRWIYKENMPTVFGVGISPLLQLSMTGV